MNSKEAIAGTMPAHSAQQGRATNIVLWVLQVLLAFQFAGGGFLKLSGAPVMVDMFADIGAGQWFRIVVGTLEILGAVGLLVPRVAGLAGLAGFAALGLCGLLVGAIATNVFVLRVDSWLALGLLLMSALIAWGRLPRAWNRAALSARRV